MSRADTLTAATVVWKRRTPPNANSTNQMVEISTVRNVFPSHYLKQVKQKLQILRSIHMKDTS